MPEDNADNWEANKKANRLKITDNTMQQPHNRDNLGRVYQLFGKTEVTKD